MSSSSVSDVAAPTVKNTGVRAKVSLSPQSTAGPYPADITLGLNTSDTRTLFYYVYVRCRHGKIVSEKSEVSLSWMLYVKPARDKHEQNVEAFRDENDRIFFRSLRDIDEGEQLFVWYSDQFAREIGIPALTPSHIQGNQQYVCNKCFRKFEYPNPLKAHMRFRCAKCRVEILSGLVESSPPVGVLRNPWMQPFVNPGMAATRQLFPTQNYPADLSPKKSEDISSSPELFERSPTILVNSGARKTNKDSTEFRLSHTLPNSNAPRDMPRCTVSSQQCATTTMTSQPIQIFNHIHPPAIPIPLDHHAFKLYYPFYGIPTGPPGFCCGRLPTDSFTRGMMSFPCGSIPTPHHHSPLHQTPTDLSLKHRKSSRLDRLDQSTHGAQIPIPMSSPTCQDVGSFPFPMPSEKAGEPLDLLPRHLYLSKSRKGHLCIYCGKLYSRKYGLKIHLRTHTGYKPLKCKVCLRPFGDPSNLNKHIRLHAEGETPYRCEFCGKVLVRRRDLVRHIKSRHPNEVDRADEIERSRENKRLAKVKTEDISTIDGLKIRDDKTHCHLDI